MQYNGEPATTRCKRKSSRRGRLCTARNEVLDKDPKLQRRLTQGVKGASIKKTEQHTPEVVDEDVDTSDTEGKPDESDDERDDDEAALTKGARKKLLREVLKGQAKRGDRKSDTIRGRRSKHMVGTVMKEMFGITSVEEYAVHGPPESNHVRHFGGAEKDGPNEKDDLRIDTRGKISWG
ncbi:hypothetical protein GALMADRAFT_212082 [Galerina marginata CBS 339.88]|uniref:Uncharacterized protein n=1 Tax=Galerina marginata (strain CBS 339.88) TaxID=685588 RepID=A0A067T6F9_GALM3|nr:hypothetical protein GALMADRAFT_212082 [Galerina marginata CBS 339.88]